MFAIEPHPAIADALTVRAIGVWNVRTAFEFEKALLAAIDALGCPPGEHLVLSDMREFELQSAEIVLFCRAMFERNDDGAGIALLVGRGGARHQIAQVMGEGVVGVFEDPAQADAWLRDRRARPSLRAA